MLQSVKKTHKLHNSASKHLCYVRVPQDEQIEKEEETPREESPREPEPKTKYDRKGSRATPKTSSGRNRSPVSSRL